MIRFMTALATVFLLALSFNANADVMFKDKSGQADHTLVFKKQADKVFLLQCPIDNKQSCVALADPSGYSFEAMTKIAKNNFRVTTAGGAIMAAMMLLVVLMLGGVTLAAAAGVFTYLAAGAIGSSILMGAIATTMGGGMYVMTAREISPDVVHIKQSYTNSRALKTGVTRTDYVVNVPNLKHFEQYVLTQLPE